MTLHFLRDWVGESYLHIDNHPNIQLNADFHKQQQSIGQLCHHADQTLQQTQMTTNSNKATSTPAAAL